MPTTRRRRTHAFIGGLTKAHRSHLECGYYWGRPHGDPPEEHFTSEQHRRATWDAYCEQIMGEWDRPGERPVAYWEYDHGLRPRPDPVDWSWPKPIGREIEMVHHLLKSGSLAPCQHSTFWGLESRPSSDEVAWIERQWLNEIESVVSYEDRLPTVRRHLDPWGTPPWFYRLHAKRLWEAPKPRVEC